MKNGQLTRSRAVGLVVLAIAAAAGSAVYAGLSLRIDTDTAALLSSELPFRQTLERYRQSFPRNEPELVLVVEARTPERAEATADEVLRRVRARPDTFAHAHRPAGGAFFRRHALLYQTPAELDRLGTRLSRMQPLLGMLQQDPSLHGLLGALGRVLERETDESDRLDPLLERLDRVVSAQLGGRPAALSWQGLIRGGSAGVGVARRVVLAQPNVEAGRLRSVREAQASLDRIAGAMGLARDGWPRVRMTGKLALAHQEVTTLLEGFAVGGPVALLLICVVLYVGFRSAGLVVATLVTLLVGLGLTAGFAALAVGRLNLISAAFAMLYVGLGVDFAIHFGLRYGALRRGAASRSEALTETRRRMLRTLTLCAVTTAIGFLAFVPTAFIGVAELGVIAGGGMLISLLTTLTVFPALLLLLPEGQGRPRVARPTGMPRPLRWLIERPVRHPRLVLGVGAAVTVFALALSPNLRFNSDPLDLRQADSEAVRTLRRLRSANRAGGRAGAYVLADSERRARQTAEALSALAEVDRATTVFDLIPPNQEQRLRQIERLALIAGGSLRLDPAQLTIEPVGEQVRAVRRFRDRLPAAGGEAESGEGPGVRRRLRGTLTAWLDSVQGLDERGRRRRVRDLHERVLEPLPLAIGQFRRSLAAERVTLASLPEGLRSRWIGPDGSYRVEVRPAGDIDGEASRRRFVRAVQGVAPAASGPTVIQVEAGEAIVAAFREATLYAVVGIVVVLLAVMRSVRLSLTVLLPLAVGSVVTAAAMVLMSIPLNFANVIALPLLLGVGVDNGVHMVQRARGGLTEPGGLLATTTARGVLFSTLTTLCGFGGLLLSPHPGTASMGQVLALGLVLIVGATLILLPALMRPGATDAAPPPDAAAGEPGAAASRHGPTPAAERPTAE